MSKLTRTAARGTVALMGAHGCLTASGYVVAVILARGLGPAEYGIYGVIYSFLVGIELIGRLGVPQSLSKLIAEDDSRAANVESTGILLTAMFYLAIFGLFWAFAPWMAEAFHIEHGARLFRLASLDIPFYGMVFLYQHILNGRRQFASEGVGISLYGVSKAVGVALLLYLGLSVAAALIVNAISSAIALTYLASRVGKPAVPLSLRFWRPIVALAIPIALFTVGSQLLLNIDLWLLNGIGVDVSESTKGLYVAALNLSRLPKLLGFVMMAVLVPSISRGLAQRNLPAVRRSVNGAMRFLSAALLPVCALMAVEARPLMSLLYSPRYADGAGLLAILVFADGLFNTVMVTLSGILIASGRAKSAAGISLAMVPVAVAGNVMLIPRLGAPGAALAAAVAMLGAMLAAATGVHRMVCPLISWTSLLKTFLAATLIGVLALVVRTEGVLLLVELIVLVAVYIGTIVALRLVTRDDLDPFFPARSGGVQ